jgi:hypothetical protein
MLVDSIRAFNHLVAFMVELDVPLQPALGIALKSESSSLQLLVPESFTDLVAQWRSVEPPSLYLIDWRTYQCVFPYEYYRCPVGHEVLPSVHSGTYIYYQELRLPRTVEESSMFSSHINAVYHP